MANGEQINERLEFQERMKGLPTDFDRTMETALMLYDLSHKFDEAIDTNKNKKISAISGGITGGIMGGIMLLIEYLRGR